MNKHVFKQSIPSFFDIDVELNDHDIFTLTKHMNSHADLIGIRATQSVIF